MSNLKIEYDMQELRDGIKASVMESLGENIADEIKAEIKADFLGKIQPKIEELATEKSLSLVEDLLKDLAENGKVSVGGGWGADPTEYTYKDFIKKEIRETVLSKEIQVRNPNSGRDIKVDFYEYVIGYCINGEVEKHIKKEVDTLRKEVNTRVKNLFDKETKEMLSETAMQVIMSSDTYRRINNNIKCIADKK